MLAIIMAIEHEKDRLFVEMIFNKYSKNMYLIAANILNNHDDAEPRRLKILGSVLDRCALQIFLGIHVHNGVTLLW